MAQDMMQPAFYGPRRGRPEEFPAEMKDQLLPLFLQNNRVAGVSRPECRKPDQGGIKDQGKGPGKRGLRFPSVFIDTFQDLRLQCQGGGFHRYFPASFFCFSSILAQVSRRVAVRLNTGFPGAESSLSRQKYPSLSNW
jgi:hypothetical protein